MVITETLCFPLSMTISPSSPHLSANDVVPYELLHLIAYDSRNRLCFNLFGEVFLRIPYRIVASNITVLDGLWRPRSKEPGSACYRILVNSLRRSLLEGSDASEHGPKKDFLYKYPSSCVSGILATVPPLPSFCLSEGFLFPARNPTIQDDPSVSMTMVPLNIGSIRYEFSSSVWKLLRLPESWTHTKGSHQSKCNRKMKKNNIHHEPRDILIHKDSFGPKKCWATTTLSIQGIQTPGSRSDVTLKYKVDELSIKSHTEEEIIRDIAKTFKTLRQINMKLNPKKCTFGMQEGIFLGYKVNAEGLKAHLGVKKSRKITVVPSTLKKCSQKSDFPMGPREAEVAFKSMKITSYGTPNADVHKEKGELIIYLAAAKEAISAVLMTEMGGKQLPVSFVSRALRGPEVNYTPMEKLVLALLSASRRLKRYFQAHTIVVITDQPIKQLLTKSEISGRMLKWKFELEGYDIQYRPRTSIKGQILADFIVERPDEESPDELMAEPEELPEPWTLFTDGSSCIDGSGAGLILTNPEGVEFTYAMRFGFEATNNEAEYEALIAGLRIAEQMGVKNLQANVDSRLVANQVNGSYVAKESGMIQYLKKVKTLASNFKEFSIKQVPRSENKKADALSKIASTSFAHLSKQVLVEELKEKSINEKEVLAIVEEEEQTWMTPIYEYLIKEILSEDKKKARVVRRKASRYTIINGTLYKKSFLGSWLWFGLPGEIVSDNRKQFRDNPFKDWCEKLCIRQCFASVKHLQANGLVKRANRSLGEGIKARLDERSKDWIGELSHVLWAHRTMIKSSNEETPFSLTYGTKAVIPAEIGMLTLRTAELDLAKNDEALEINLDLIEKKENKQQFKRRKVKLRWKSTTTLKFKAQASGRGKWSTVAMMQATPRTKENLALNGKDHTKLRSY
ncbi:reverse transcriptase domain-containing protein [Tanacetum coccineum]